MDGDEVGSVLGAQRAQDAGAEPGAQAAQVSSLGAAGAVPEGGAAVGGMPGAAGTGAAGTVAAGAASAGAAGSDGVAAGAEADYRVLLAERDAKIAELEGAIAEAAKSAEAAEALRTEMDELRRQGEEERVSFELASAGARNVKAARALLDEHGGDVAELKGAEPWLFADEPPRAQTGRTGLPNAGVATDEGAQMKRWRALAGLSEGA